MSDNWCLVLVELVRMRHGGEDCHICFCCLQTLGQRGKVVRVFDSGDLRVVMKEGGTWTLNPECCTLLSEEGAATAAAADTANTVESSSDEEDTDSIQMTRTLTYTYTHLTLCSWYTLC